MSKKKYELEGELEFEIIIKVTNDGQSININSLNGEMIFDLKVISVLEFAKLNYYNDKYPKKSKKY